jgi:hypothetical protein
MKTFTCVLLIFIVSSGFVFASTDKDGCWSGELIGVGSCVVEHESWWNKYKSDEFIQVWKNICDRRVYATYCLEWKNGEWLCGASGIGAGKTKSFNAHNATGKSKIKSVVGSTKWEKDWVCNHKMSN